MSTRARDERLSDAEKEARSAVQQKLAKQRLQTARILNTVFSAPDGPEALRYIMGICGYQKTSVVGDPVSGNLHLEATLYNEAQRNVYLQLRALLRPELLVKVENQLAGTVEKQQNEMFD
jgi:hypothetical protein